jgi:serine/threonine protein kinase
MQVPAGTRLGHYEVIALLGAGGMGQVYKARDMRLGRSVALKMLHAGIAQEPVLRERFEREARAVSTLSHPHICTLYDVGLHEGSEFLVIELVEGETLADRLRRGRLPLDLAIRHAIEIAEGLDHAHRHGITHRDLKPANVILARTGAKLLDFGLAKLRDPGAEATKSLESSGRDWSATSSERSCRRRTCQPYPDR